MTKHQQLILDVHMHNLHEVFNIDKTINIQIHPSEEEFKASFTGVHPERVYGAIKNNSSDIIEIHLMWFLFDEQYLEQLNKGHEHKITLEDVLVHEFCHYALGDGSTVDGSHGPEFQTLLFDKLEEISKLPKRVIRITV